MYLESLTPYNFRNLANETISFSPRINLIAGNNGQGKTNLLEAVSLLSAGKSFRTAKAGDFARWEKEEASVFGKAVLRTETANLGITFRGQERELFINHNPIKSLKDFIGRLSLVTFTPHDIQLVKGPPLERRRFLDKHLVDIRPAYLERLMLLHRALKNKNALLKQGRADKSSLEPWNKLIAEAASEIAASRAAFVDELNSQIGELYKHFSKFEAHARVELQSAFIRNGAALPADGILEILNEYAGREIRLRTALAGPQRDDLLIGLHGKDARAFASQGESRSLVLALKIAVINIIEERRRESPIVILDDVDAELDLDRRKALLDLLVRSERQVMISGTNEGMLNTLQDEQSKRFKVTSGAFSEVR